MGGSVGEQKEKRAAEVRYMRIFWVLQLPAFPRNTNITSKFSIFCRRNGRAQLQSTTTDDVFSGVARLFGAQGEKSR